MSKTRPTYKSVLYNFAVYGIEINPEFLKRWSVSGIILPTAVHNPGDFNGAAVRSRHTVPWSTSQRSITGREMVRWQYTCFLIHVRLRKCISVKINHNDRAGILLIVTWTQTLWHVIAKCQITSLHLSPPLHVSVDWSCWCRGSFPWRRSPTVRCQSSRHHSLWYNDLKTTAGGSVSKGIGAALCEYLTGCWQ